MKRARHVLISLAAAAALCGIGAPARADSYSLSISSPDGFFFGYSTGHGRYGHYKRRHHYNHQYGGHRRYYKDHYGGHRQFRHQPRYWYKRYHGFYRPWDYQPRRHYYGHRQHRRGHGGYGYWR